MKCPTINFLSKKCLYMKCPKAVKGQFSHIQGVLALNVFYNMVMRRFDTQQNPRFYNDLFDLKTITKLYQNEAHQYKEFRVHFGCECTIEK